MTVKFQTFGPQLTGLSIRLATSLGPNSNSHHKSTIEAAPQTTGTNPQKVLRQPLKQADTKRKGRCVCCRPASLQCPLLFDAGQFEESSKHVVQGNQKCVEPGSSVTDT